MFLLLIAFTSLCSWLSGILIERTKTQINTAYAAINIDKGEVTINAESSADAASSVIANQSANEQAPGQPNAQSYSIDSVTQILSNDSFRKNVDFINSQKNEKNSHADERIFMLHVFPMQYFCPGLTTGENVRNEETYCEHIGESSWAENNSWKGKVLRFFGPKWKTRIIKLKRKVL